MLEIEIFSDVVCPWCFIGKRRLDKVLATDLGENVNLRWRPYQLYPQISAEGVDRGDGFLRLGRDGRGHIQLRRFYVYDFSTDGQDRWFGIAILLGQNIEYIRMEHPQGPIIQNTKL